MSYGDDFWVVEFFEVTVEPLSHLFAGLAESELVRVTDERQRRWRRDLVEVILPTIPQRTTDEQRRDENEQRDQHEAKKRALGTTSNLEEDSVANEPTPRQDGVPSL